VSRAVERVNAVAAPEKQERPFIASHVDLHSHGGGFALTKSEYFRDRGDAGRQLAAERQDHPDPTRLALPGYQVRAGRLAVCLLLR